MAQSEREQRRKAVEKEKEGKGRERGEERKGKEDCQSGSRVSQRTREAAAEGERERKR